MSDLRSYYVFTVCLDKTIRVKGFNSTGCFTM